MSSWIYELMASWTYRVWVCLWVYGSWGVIGVILFLGLRIYELMGFRFKSFCFSGYGLTGL